MGIFDTPVNRHPEFAGDGKLINVVTEGYRAYTDPHRPGINAGDRLLRRHLPLLQRLTGHAEQSRVHVAGISAANRDGVGMHGVAFDSQVISVDNDNDGPAYGEFRHGRRRHQCRLAGDDQQRCAGDQQQLGRQYSRLSVRRWRDPNALHFELKDAQEQFDQVKPLLGSGRRRLSGRHRRSAQKYSGAFAAGNDGNYNQPDVISGLAYFVPDIAPNWLSVASVAQDAASTNSVPYTISSFSSRCGYTASFCVSSPGSKIYSTVANGSDPANPVSDYGNKNGTRWRRRTSPARWRCCCSASRT